MLSITNKIENKIENKITNENENKNIIKIDINSNRTNHFEESQYLDLIREILDKGEPRNDRTGTGTKSIFAPTNIRFKLEGNVFPLLTTKRVGLRMVFEELIWFIRGQTDGQILKDKGMKGYCFIVLMSNNITE